MMPFPGGLEATANGTLLFSAACAFLYALMIARPASLKRTAAKTLAALLLALLAVLEGGPWLLVTALLASAAGDAFLSRDGEPAFLGGLACFLLGHLLYVTLFWAGGAGSGFLFGVPWRAAAAVVLLIFAAGMFRLLYPALPAQMRLPVAVYVAAIAAMGVAALTVPVPFVVLGAGLFILSDALLAVGRFLTSPGSRHHAWMGQAVWASYYLAQTTITLGLLL